MRKSVGMAMNTFIIQKEVIMIQDKKRNLSRHLSASLVKRLYASAPRRSGLNPLCL